VHPTLLYIKSEVAIPAKAGIRLRNTGFPRIKYGAGSIKPGMTNNGKGFVTHHTSRVLKECLFKAGVEPRPL
jgi:hypothetical protein